MSQNRSALHTASLGPARAGKADLTAQLRPLSPHLPCRPQPRAWLPGRRGREEGAGKKAQESGGFRKGSVSETAARGAGALKQTRELGGRGGLWCCLLTVRPTWDTPVTVSPRFTSGPAASTSTGFRLQDRNPHVQPSSLGCPWAPGAQPDTGVQPDALCDLGG